MTENERIIKTQQRNIQKHERTQGEYRRVADKALSMPVDADKVNFLWDAIERNAPMAITKKGELRGVYIPIEELRRLGVVHG